VIALTSSIGTLNDYVVASLVLPATKVDLLGGAACGVNFGCAGS